MKSKVNKIISFSFAAIMIFSSAAISYGASKDITRTNIFYSKTKKYEYAAQKEIQQDGKTYKLIPEEKKKLIQDKYTNILNEIKYVGVITVEEGGKWTMIHRPFYRNKVELNQEILKLMLLKF